MKLSQTKKALVKWYRSYLCDDSVIALEMEVNPLVGSLLPLYERELHSSVSKTFGKEKKQSPRMERLAPRLKKGIRGKGNNPVRVEAKRLLGKKRPLIRS